MHCIGGTGRTGFNSMVLKRLYSPYNGWSFDGLLNTLREEYKSEAYGEVAEQDGEAGGRSLKVLYKEREDLIKSLPSRLFAHDRPVISQQYYRYVRGNGY